MRADKKAVEKLTEKVNQLTLLLEKMRVAEYMIHINNPRRILWVNFLRGVAKGLGTAIGFIVLGAIVIFLIQKALDKKLPEIAQYISKIIEFVGKYRS